MHRLLEQHWISLIIVFSELEKQAGAFSDYLSALPLTQAFDVILKFLKYTSPPTIQTLQCQSVPRNNDTYLRAFLVFKSLWQTSCKLKGALNTQKAPFRIYPDPSKGSQMAHCTSHLFCTSFSVCFRVTSEKGQAMGPCCFSHSSVSMLKKKKKKRQLERKFVRLHAVASSFLALSESTAASGRKKKQCFISFVNLYLHKVFLFPSPGIAPSASRAAESELFLSCWWQVGVTAASSTVKEWLHAGSSNAAKSRTGTFRSLAVIKV